MSGRVLHVQICAKECLSEAQHAFSVSCLSASEVPIVYLGSISSELLEGFPLLHLQVVSKDAQSCTHVSTVRVIQLAELVSVDCEACEIGSQIDHL